MFPPFLFSCLSLLGEFVTYLNFCHSLWFEDNPDYPYLKELFRGLFHKLGYTYDYLLDWSTKKVTTAGHSSSQLSTGVGAVHGGSNLQLSSSHSCRDEYAELEGCNDDRHPWVNSISPHPQVSICRKVRSGVV